MVMSKSLSLEFGSITNANVDQLRLINIKTLPVRYSDKFYGDLITNGNSDYLKYAILNGFAVGSVCARIEDTENVYDKKLYIMTLTVLPTYRRRGIASSLLEHILAIASKNTHIGEVYLHVQTSNEEALSFYKTHGFDNIGLIKNYYKRIDPPDCFILRLDMIKYRGII